VAAVVNDRGLSVDPSAQDWNVALSPQPHSVRGFLSGTIGKKMGLTVISTKGEDGERSYSIKG